MALKGIQGPIARRYARALLDVVASANDAKAPAEVRAALESAKALLDSRPDLLHALTHPALAVDARKRVASAVWAGAPELLKRLLHLLIERDRVRLLPAIAEAFAAAWNESRGVLTAEVASATALDPKDEKALEDALKKGTGKSVELGTRVDARLLGGLRVSLLGRTYDGSVVAQLESLRRRLRGAA